MQNRDNLEKFIKNEVDRIDFNDADSMWQEFQVQLQKEVPEPKRSRYFVIFFFFLTFFALGGFFLMEDIFNQENKSDFSTDQEISANKEVSPLSQTQVKDDKEQFSTTRINNDNHDFEQLEQSFSNNRKRASHETSTGKKSKGIGSRNEDLSIGIRESSFESESSRVIKEEVNVRKQKANSEKGQFYFDNKEINQGETIEKITSDRYSENEQISGVTGHAQLEEGGLGKFQGEVSVGEVTSQEKMEESSLFIERIPLPKLKEFWSGDPLENLLQVDLQHERSKSIRKNIFLTIESSFATNNIQQYALGSGKYFFLNENSAIKLQGGGSLDIGYSLSQDSVFVLNGLSIEEIRRDKDLKNIWNAYLDFGFYQAKNKWKFGIGMRGSYAMVNQFYLTEHTRTTHLGTFYTSRGTTNYQKVESSSWNGMSRMSLETYLDINYQIGTNYSIGISAIKRLNKLIAKDMANQAYSNTPVRVGVSLNKYF